MGEAGEAIEDLTEEIEFLYDDATATVGNAWDGALDYTGASGFFDDIGDVDVPEPVEYIGIAASTYLEMGWESGKSQLKVLAYGYGAMAAPVPVITYAVYDGLQMYDQVAPAPVETALALTPIPDAVSFIEALDAGDYRMATKYGTRVAVQLVMDFVVGRAVAKAVPSSAPKPRRKFASGKPPHTADVTVYRDGHVTHADTIKSGNMTPEEAALGFPNAQKAAHAEARAVKYPLRKGDTMIIEGQYAPCPSCKGKINEAVRQTGATIIYKWGDNYWPRGD